MNNLLKISDLAERYSVTSRTLRYYEEIGLINSIRANGSQYRYYDETAVSRLEYIIFLRKLQLPLKDIVEILSTKDVQILMDAFSRKLNLLENEISDRQGLRRLVDKLLRALKEKGCKSIDGLSLLDDKTVYLVGESTPDENMEEENKMEDLKMTIDNINKLTDVRIIRLRPMKVALYRAEGNEPENEAWKVLKEWVHKKGLDKLFTTRYFGFNNPSPTPGNPVYGYEVWVTVTDDMEESEGIEIKTFEGGLYAVTNTYLQDIQENWKKLSAWVNGSKYAAAEHQWLEEHIILDESTWGSNLQLDLYHPIKEN